MEAGIGRLEVVGRWSLGITLSLSPERLFALWVAVSDCGREWKDGGWRVRLMLRAVRGAGLEVCDHGQGYAADQECAGDAEDDGNGG